MAVLDELLLPPLLAPPKDGGEAFNWDVDVHTHARDSSDDEDGDDGGDGGSESGVAAEPGPAGESVHLYAFRKRKR